MFDDIAYKFTNMNTHETTMKHQQSPLLNDIFLNAVYQWPHRPALICGSQSWSYQQLYQQALKYTYHFQRQIGPHASACIAIYGTKSLETAAAILGALLAGYTYMPLDITLPAKRLQMTLNIAKPQLLVITTLNPFLQNQIEQLQYDPIMFDIVHSNQTPIHTDKAMTGFCAEKIAYLLFTSGSTGQPKGVCISHRAVVSALDMLFEHAPFNGDDKIAGQSAFCYDLSVFDLFSAFKVGACVHLLPPEIMKVPKNFIEYINRHELTSVYMVSSALEYILKYATKMRNPLPLKKILLTGDPISPTLIALMRENMADICKIWNLYSAVEMPYAYAQPVNLLRDDINLKYFPLQGSQIKPSVDEDGVLVIQGSVLFSGYITTDNSIENLQSNPIRQYRTGDCVRLDEKGMALFGRVDRQIKILGNRIELDDIEINIESLEFVQEAAVIVDSSTQQLFAFIVVRKEFLDTCDFNSTFRKRCSDRLPAIMIPHDFFLISEMPRTTSGKKDRKALSITHATAS